MKALVLGILLVFDPSPSPDVARYACEAWHRRMVEVPKATGCLEARCFIISPPLALTCEVVPHTGPETFAAEIPDVTTGVVYGRAWAIDTSGNESVRIGWSEASGLPF